MRQKENIFFFIWIVLLMAILIGCSSRGGGGPGKATLTWIAPTTDEGGGALTGLSGYYVYYGTSPRTGSDPKECGMCGYTTKTAGITGTTYIINKLASGTYYFSVTAYDTSGNESAFSNEGAKTIP